MTEVLALQLLSRTCGHFNNRRKRVVSDLSCGPADMVVLRKKRIGSGPAYGIAVKAGGEG